MKRIAFITGASSGFGKALAYKLAENNFDLILLARRRNVLETIEEDLKSKFQSNIYILDADVREFTALEASIATLPDSFKNIEILVNSAGLAAGMDKFQDAKLSDWETMIDTNVKGLLYVSKLVVPFLQANGKAQIINIGSIAGRYGYPMGSVYCGTKSAVSTISQGMTIDLLGTGVKVCNIEPGLAETEFALVRFEGDADRAANVYKGLTALSAEDVAEVTWSVINMPYHINIQNLLVTSTDQATATIVNRK